MRISFSLVIAIVGSIASCESDNSSSSTRLADAARDGGAASSSDDDDDDGGGGGRRGDSGTSRLGSGPFTLVYAGTSVGSATRSNRQGKATFDGAHLVGYEASDVERPQAGTNLVNEGSGDELVALGRWSGGTTSGKFYNAGGLGLLDLPANGGFHYAIGTVADTLPASGAYEYLEVAKTAATLGDGSAAPGTVSGSLGASFAGADTKIGFSITLDIPGDATYTIATAGGASDLSASEAELAESSAKGAFLANLQVASTGAACGGSCEAAVRGFVAGPAAERVALVAHVVRGGGAAAKSVSAAIVFKR